MAFEFGSVMDRFLHSGALRWWRRAARHARDADTVALRRYRSRARQLRTHLNEVIFAADEKLALPRVGSASFPKPYGTDWGWRPALWRGPLPVPGISSVQTKSMLGDEVTLFHDCIHSELTLRQIRNLREADLAPYGLRMDVFKFDGSFLSLVIDLPKAALRDLTREHVIRIDTIVEVEKPIEIFARLNIKHGPNTDQFVRELPLNEEQVMVEFDMAYSNLNEKRLERGWLDIIFEGPEMNQVTLRDITFSRRLRAAV